MSKIYNHGDRVKIKKWEDVKKALCEHQGVKTPDENISLYRIRKPFCGKVFFISRKESWEKITSQTFYSLMDENGGGVIPHFSDLMFENLKEKLDKILEE